MLQLLQIHTFYGESHVLQGVNLHVKEGQIVALLGRNGMGKTTTINTIMGFKKPSSGTILFRGTNITGLPSYQISQRGIAVVPQGRRLFPSLTVMENLTIGWRKSRRGHYNLKNIYELFPILEARSKHRGHQLSGGEQQMLAIGRSLMTNPDFLLMDEPFEGLAPAVVNEIGQKIIDLKGFGLSMLLVEQNVQVAASIADHIYIMNKGKIVYGGSPKDKDTIGEIKEFIAL